MDMTTSMRSRQDSASCLLLLDSESDAFEVYDPPAWKPGRFLQFADISSVEDEASVRPVSSLHTDRIQFQDCLEDSQHARASSQELHIDLVQMSPSRSFWRTGSLSRRTTILLTACVSVGLTALGLLSFVI